MNNSTNTQATDVACGRRASDQWMGKLLTEVLSTVMQRRVNTPLPEHRLTAPRIITRRPRRTKKAMKIAFAMAADHVRQTHPKWSNTRVQRRARSLVRQRAY